MPADPRYFTSSELVAIVGTTRKTLRVIEARGLVRPARRSGTRRYSQECLRRLWLVMVLRRLDFSLDEVARLLGAGDGTRDAGEAASALSASVTRMIRKIDGSIRDLELAREALAITRTTLEACASCKQERAACDACASNGKLDAVATVLLTRAGTTDPPVETSVRRAGPADHAELVHGLRRSRA